MNTKKLFLAIMFICCASVSFAQLEVIKNTGKVGIGLPANTTPLSKLAVGDAGALTDFVSLSAPPASCQTALSIVNPGYSGTYARKYGLTSQLGAVPGESVGIMSSCTSASPAPYSATGYGVLGVAKNFTLNYGVMGVLEGSNSGAGIVGIKNNSINQFVAISGQYAGYFDGNVKAIGTIDATSYTTSSDIRFKKDISELNSEKSLKSILMMKPVEYRLEQQYIEIATIDSITQSEITKSYQVYDEKSQVFQKKHYGLIAQELQELYPDLVYEVDDKGYLGINYMEIIPMLIQSVQELSKEINILKNAENVLKSNTDVTGISAIDGVTSKAALYQNIPNPFNQSTEIKFYIPENAKSAQLCIYNLQGKQIKQIVIAARGEASQVISGSELTAGMYLYALIVDGKEVDTKRMILTE